MKYKQDKTYFLSLQKNRITSWIRTLTTVVIALFLIFSLLMTITPWQQTSRGSGVFIAMDPNDRVQDIQSPVPGRISSWHVTDGDRVKQGDPLVEIVDNDPNFVKRLVVERDAVLKRYQVAKIASETSLLNYNRQKKLLDQGLSSRIDFENSLIEYKKLLAAEASAAADLAMAEVRLSRQEKQLVLAPRDGTVLRILHGAGSLFVQEGDILAVFVPQTLQPAVELYISGNDLPLVFPGRHVRLQFEGWPAVQFSGWPSVAVGTFGGVVSVVDPSATYQGKFRIVVEPDEEGAWPDTRYLRQGTRVFGWVLLDSVKLGYELWRQFNGFPPSVEKAPNVLKRDDAKGKGRSKSLQDKKESIDA